MKGMTLRAMADACNGIYYGGIEYEESIVSSITIDSRKVEKDGMFVAIKGERSDGHDYINACYEAGALCCISEKYLPDNQYPYILVKSSLQALKDLARMYRMNLNVKVVGITGSVGKTSTKETIAAILSEKYKVLKTQGNFNNEIGLPLTVFRLTEEDEIAVLEMGISDFGEMTRLTDIAKPDICVITNIGCCHLENLKTRDGILSAKTEIFKSMNHDGTVILNGDDDKLITIQHVYNKEPVFFGIDYKYGIYADQIENLGLEGIKCCIHGLKTQSGTESIDVTIPVPGSHMVYNALAGAAVGIALGLAPQQIRNGINHLETIAGRNHIIKENGYLIIDDCYNANPVSMKSSLDVIDTAIGRKVCILGDMFELGKDEKQLHFDVGEYLGTKSIDLLLTAGTLSKEIALGAKDYNDTHYNSHDCTIVSFETRDQLIEHLSEYVKKGDNILVKASHGMEFPKVIDVLCKM